MKTAFLDTYALYEIAVGNPEYAPWSERVEAMTTRLNLMELYYRLLESYGQPVAEKYFGLFLPAAVDFDGALLKKAMRFRFENKVKRFSYVDCIGYQLAMEMGVPFLTGDSAFANLPNVAFLK